MNTLSPDPFLAFVEAQYQLYRIGTERGDGLWSDCSECDNHPRQLCDFHATRVAESYTGGATEC